MFSFLNVKKNILWGTPPVILKIMIPENKGFLWSQTHEGKQIHIQQLDAYLKKKRLIIAVDGGFITPTTHQCLRQWQPQMMQTVCGWSHPQGDHLLSHWDLVQQWIQKLPKSVCLFGITLWSAEALHANIQRPCGTYHVVTSQGHYVITLEQNIPIYHRRFPTQITPFHDDAITTVHGPISHNNDIARCLAATGALVAGYSSWAQCRSAFLWRWRWALNHMLWGMGIICLLLSACFLWLQYDMERLQEDLKSRLSVAKEHYPHIMDWPAVCPEASCVRFFDGQDQEKFMQALDPFYQHQKPGSVSHLALSRQEGTVIVESQRCAP